MQVLKLADVILTKYFFVYDQFTIKSLSTSFDNSHHTRGEKFNVSLFDLWSSMNNVYIYIYISNLIRDWNSLNKKKKFDFASPTNSYKTYQRYYAALL